MSRAYGLRALSGALGLLVLAGAAKAPPPATPPEAMAFGADYRAWLGAARVPVLAVDEVRARALARGFRVLDLDTPPEGWPRLAPGDGVLVVLAGRTALLARIGTLPLRDGLRVAAAHIDAPALRIEPRAAAAAGASGTAALLAHAAGGIKPYQWSGLPLVLAGVVAPVHGPLLRLLVGPDDGFGFLLEPRAPKAEVPGVPALAPPRPKDEAEPVYRLLAASAAAAGDTKGGAKARLWDLLQARYGLTAEDLEAAELYAVPAALPRDAGLDRAYVLGPGQDDRACSFAVLRALLDAGARPLAHTALAVLVDREEIGSTGVSGMRSALFELALQALFAARGEPGGSDAVAAAFRATRALSTDVKAGVSPLFPEVHDLKNAPVLGRGPTIVKFTGHGGKYGGSDASPEMGRFVRAVAAAARVPVQSSESGKVDEGGGGTVARFLAERGMAVIDVGVPVLSMHAPHELSAKADVWNLARLVGAFFEAP